MSSLKVGLFCLWLFLVQWWHTFAYSLEKRHKEQWKMNLFLCRKLSYLGVFPDFPPHIFHGFHCMQSWSYSLANPLSWFVWIYVSVMLAYVCIKVSYDILRFVMPWQEQYSTGKILQRAFHPEEKEGSCLFKEKISYYRKTHTILQSKLVSKWF